MAILVGGSVVHGDHNDASAKINNFDDSATELTVAEFAHLLLRYSQARLPPRKRGRGVAKVFAAMMEENILPRAQRDTLAFVRSRGTPNEFGKCKGEE